MNMPGTTSGTAWKISVTPLEHEEGKKRAKDIHLTGDQGSGGINL